MLVELIRTVTMQLQGSGPLDALHVTFAWELMEPLAQLCERGSFREVLRLRNLHHLAINLCRKLLDEHATRGQGISDRQWPWINTWIRLGILTVAPSIREHSTHTNDMQHYREKYHRHIWQCHYAGADLWTLVPSDFNWMVHVIREARTCESMCADTSTGVMFPSIITYTMAMLCEAPGITSGARCKEVYVDVSWALGNGGAFFHAALKLVRAMFGQNRDVKTESLRSFIKATGPSFDLSRTLATTVKSCYQSSDDFYSMPESYPFHMAYLDIVQGFISLHDDRMPSIFTSHIGNCIALASLLRTNGHNWFNSERQMLRACLGRQTDDRRWRRASSGPLIESDNNLPNSFIRDLWRRLCQIVGTYLDVQPLPDDVKNEDGLLTLLTLGCMCWQIYDTHPVTDETLSSMTTLLRVALSWTHIKIAAIDKQIEIQRAFRCIFQVLKRDEPLLGEQTQHTWRTVGCLLRDHIDTTLETLQPPLTADALALDT